MRKTFFLVLIFLSGFSLIRARAQVLPADSLALVAFYDSTNGANWTNNSGWLSDNVVNWFGVSVAGGRVNVLNLANNNLTGSIPAELGNLSNLIFLSVSNNNINGSLPSSISQLVNIQTLLLNNNQLNGFIPQGLGDLQNLRDLRLSENQFYGPLPETIATISSLRVLDLQNNLELLGVIPAQIVNIPLTDLRFFNTNICEPDNPGYNAWKLMVTSYIPSNVSCGNRQADSLALVTLYNTTDGPNWSNNTNWLTGNLETWEGVELTLDRISRLNLTNNNLSGSLPVELADLRYLQSLEFSFNNISGSIPSGVFELSFLETLFLQSNQLTGELPPALFNQLSLKWLALGQNNWTGTIPPEIINLQNLEYLVLNYTGLSGPIPAELGFLRNMRLLLSLDNNQLTGEIPSTFGNMPSLEILRLQNNQLTGAVPSFSDSFQNLVEYDLSGNQLRDLNDQNWLSAIQDLRVTDNFFEFDDIDLNLSLFKDSTYYAPQRPFGTANDFYVERGDSIVLSQGPVGGSEVAYQWFKDGQPVPGANDFEYPITRMDTTFLGTYFLEASSGTIPGFTLVSEPITLATSIPSPDEAALMAFYNATDGPNWTWSTNWGTAAPIDQWFGVSAVDNRVTRLRLGLNNLNGSIPPDIGSLEELTYFWIGNNFDLTGSIPPEIGRLQNLDTIGFSFSGLSGSIPDELFELTNLRRLSMSNTQLSGELSARISNLRNLKHIALWNSPLSGEIPEEFWDMVWLEKIYLGTNQQTGEIPAKIGQWDRVDEFWISNSNLTGMIPPEIGNLQSATLLNLYENKLFGPVPDEVINMNNLRTMNIQGNELDYLPDLTSMDSLKTLNISDNRFTYSDILPNQALITENTSQKPFGDSTEVQAFTFEALRLDPGLEIIDGQQYQWFKNGEALEDGIDHYYEIADFREGDGGLYQLDVTHREVDSLVLTSSPLFVVVNEGNPPRPQAVEVISPNGDGLNDEMTIKNIELYPEHRVLIYDVLGRLVFETTEYDNINNPFIGIGNVNGAKELPSGTYYYLIDVGDTRKNGTGYFVMKRQ